MRRQRPSELVDGAREEAPSPESLVDEELRLHLEGRAEELVAAGASAEEAQREALRRFGDLEAASRRCLQYDRQRAHAFRNSSASCSSSCLRLTDRRGIRPGDDRSDGFAAAGNGRTEFEDG